MYCSISDVRNVIGISSTSDIPDAQITQAITWAEDEIDRLTNTSYYPSIDSGTATSGGNTSLTDSTKSATWTAHAYIGYAVYIYTGTGKGQIREITENTTTALTVATWTTNPDATSKYYITYYNKITELYDGNNKNYMMLRYQPVVQVDALSVNGVTVTPSTIYLYNNTGKIQLSQTSEATLFTPDDTNYLSQIVSVTYWYGVVAEQKRGLTLLLPQQIMRLCAVIAGLKALAYMVGVKYNALNSFGLPDFTGSTAPVYQSLRGTIDNLNNEAQLLLNSVVGKYAYMS